MSTTTVEVRGPNKALFRTGAVAGSAILCGSLAFLALTYAPSYETPPDVIETIIDGVPVPPKPILPPPPDPILPDRPIIATPEPVALTAPPVLTTRPSKATTANPLPSEVPAGPVASEPVIFGQVEPVASGGSIAEPPPLAAVPVLPEVVAEPPPPIPKMVINPVRSAGANPTFPTRALEAGISGEVTLSFTVSPTGKVENIDVTGESPGGYGFARAAREAIRNWTFAPQTIDGVPVAYPARYTISFKLED
jgi:periplasmic protein TonB